MPLKLATLGVEATAYEEFTAAVLRKHGKLRGHVQHEATQAIRQHTRTLREAP